MQIWRLQTNIDGGDVAEYCYNNSVIAMGWGHDEKDREILRETLTFEKFCD